MIYKCYLNPDIFFFSLQLLITVFLLVFLTILAASINLRKTVDEATFTPVVNKSVCKSAFDLK